MAAAFGGAVVPSSSRCTTAPPWWRMQSPRCCAQTHRNFELLVCDDGSRDATPATLAAIEDGRLRVFRHAEKRGAAAARNTCLGEARGDYIAYLDSDNLWHPRYLELMLEAFERWPGTTASYAGYFDVQTDAAGKSFLRDAKVRPFQLEDQLEDPFVDLNSFVHRRALFDVLGGFDERLVRRQDYDLVMRYCWARAPRHVPYALNLYRRIVGLGQITDTQGQDLSAPALIAEKVAGFTDPACRRACPAGSARRRCFHGT